MEGVEGRRVEEHCDVRGAGRAGIEMSWAGKEWEGRDGDGVGGDLAGGESAWRPGGGRLRAWRMSMSSGMRIW